MSGFESGLVGGFFQSETLGSHFGNLAGPSPTLGDGAEHGFNSWDTNLPVFSQTSPLALAAPLEDTLRDRDLGVISSDDEDDSIDSFILQLTALAQRAMRAIRGLVQRSTPLTVSSPQVNQALEDTNTLIHIVNELTAGSEPTEAHSLVDDGLIFLALASHHRLLALFKAICDSIHRDLESIALNNEQQRPDLRRDAQLVMILQLLMHLINRIDQNLFQDRRGSESGGQVTPVTPTSQMDPLLIEVEGSSCTRGLKVLAGGIVRTIPNQHAELRHSIRELQMRIEHSEFL